MWCLGREITTNGLFTIVENLNIDCPPTYPPGCKVVFVGEAPGKEEVYAKEGFVGPVGKCLQRACGLAGIEWLQVGRTNVAKRRPPDNKFKEAFYETVEEPIYTKTGKLSKVAKKIVRPTEEYLQWVSALRSELQVSHPNLIVACGNEALEALTGQSGITDYRGSILPDKWGDNLKVLAVEHPSYIIRGNLADFWILVHDLKKAKREMEFPKIQRESYIIYPNPDLDLVLGFLARLAAHNDIKWTLDIETRAGTLACFAIAFIWPGCASPTTFCIPIQTTSGPYWSLDDELEIWRALYETTRANSLLCNQNIEYDIDYLLRYGIEPSGVYLDTMLAHSLLYPEFPKGLDFLCSFYLDDVVYYKWMGSDQVTGYTKDEELWERCCKDAVYTLRIVDKIDNSLKERGLFKFYHGPKTQT